MSFTREQWARGFLTALGNTNPTQATVDWVVGWTVAETGTGGGATYNLLNTTQKEPGSTQFNGVGVQNFTSFTQGTTTNALVLGQGFAGYSAIRTALLNNDVNTLSNSPNVRQGLTTWCGGCGYGASFQSIGAAHRNDTFSYGSSSNVPAPTPAQAVQAAAAAAGNNFQSGNSGGCDQPSSAVDIVGSINYLICQSQTLFVSWGEHIAVFVIALLLLGVGVYLLAQKPIDAAVGSAVQAAKSGVKDAGEAAVVA